MEKSYSESYAAAGVDITAGYRSVELMKQYVARTMNEHCIGGLGGFGGLFELDCTGCFTGHYPVPAPNETMDIVYDKPLSQSQTKKRL